MEAILKVIKGVSSIELVTVTGAGIVAFLFGGWSALMAVLITLQAVDIISGLMKGKKVEDVGSKSFFKGIKKKVGMWFLVILANMIDVIAFGGVPVAVTGVVGFLIAGEGISITENLADLGVPIPEFITKYLSQLKDKADNTVLSDEKKEDADETV